MPERVIYLASASPRRRALVGALGLPVATGVAPFDEDAASAAYTGETSELAEHLACAKAGATLRARAAELTEGALIVAADTTVLLDGESLGKPRDDEEARQMLTRLRARWHQVVTAVAVAPPGATAGRAIRSFCVTTRVLMRNYTDDEVAAYIATGDPHDKAGAYAIQHAGFHPVVTIEGCYLGVMGLPLCALVALLESVEGVAQVDQQSHWRQERESRALRCPWSAACRPPLPEFEFAP